MNRSAIRGCALVLSASLAAGCGSVGFTPQPPEMSGSPKLWIPNFVASKLANGVTVHANADPYLPMVSITVGIRGGFLHDVPSHAGLSSVVAGLMTYRTESLNPFQVAAVFDAIGSPIEETVLADGIVLRVDVMEDRIEGAVKLLAEILQRSLFDASSLKYVKNQQLLALDHLLSDPTATARLGLQQAIFGRDHPMGVSPIGTRRSLAAMKLEDVRVRAAQILRPSNISIAVAGRVPAETVLEVVSKYFGAWKEPSAPRLAALARTAPEVAKRKRVFYVPRPGLVQTEVFIGRVGLPTSHRDQPMLTLALRRVSGKTSDWLRGVENVTYGVSRIDVTNSETGMVGLSFAVDAQATRLALESVLRNYDSRPSGSFDSEKIVLLTIEAKPSYTLRGRTFAVVDRFIRGLPDDHWTKLREHLDDMQDIDMQTVVIDYLSSSTAQVVLVGDPEVIRREVPPLGLGELTALDLNVD